MKKILFALTLLIPVAMQAQTFTTEKDSVSGDLVLKGTVHFKDLVALPTFNWTASSAAYKPKAEAVSVLQKELPKYRMVVLLGSWCGDSQLQLPHLYKVLQEAKIPERNVTLYALDHSKKGLGQEAATYKVERVPTIVVLDGDREVGRIIESPRKTLEEDLATIVTNK